MKRVIAHHENRDGIAGCHKSCHPGPTTSWRDVPRRVLRMNRLDSLRAQLGGPRDGALLRYSLGAALLEEGNAGEAVAQLHAALDFDQDYSAAWKLLGKACAQTGDTQAAVDAWRRGIAVAQVRGDVQAAKEMQVFLRRMER